MSIDIPVVFPSIQKARDCWHSVASEGGSILKQPGATG